MGLFFSYSTLYVDVKDVSSQKQKQMKTKIFSLFFFFLNSWAKRMSETNVIWFPSIGGDRYCFSTLFNAFLWPEFLISLFYTFVL